jgi:hypothetical protein
MYGCFPYELHICGIKYDRILSKHPLELAIDSTPLWPNGNFGNSTSFGIYFK